jgi:hypothetical protein
MFIYSHEFGNLLVTQLVPTLEGKELYVRLRSTLSGHKTIIWPDLSADDNIHRPIDCIIENMSSYRMELKYIKMFKKFKEMKKVSLSVNFYTNTNKDDDTQGAGQHTFAFKDSHPGK